MQPHELYKFQPGRGLTLGVMSHFPRRPQHGHPKNAHHRRANHAA